MSEKAIQTAGKKLITALQATNGRAARKEMAFSKYIFFDIFFISGCQYYIYSLTHFLPKRRILPKSLKVLPNS